MGTKLLDYYNKVEKIGGLKARMRLAVITQISSQKAGDEPDSPANVSKFEEALKSISQEFK
jgi:hypothetical protein